MSRLILIGVTVLLLAVSGCSAHATTESVPAILQAAPDAEARAELTRLVHDAVGQYHVTFTFATLQEQGFLLLERTPARGPGGHRLPGRDLSEPERFEVWLQGEQCVLRQVRTGAEWPLEHARCRARD